MSVKPALLFYFAAISVLLYTLVGAPTHEKRPSVYQESPDGASEPAHAVNALPVVPREATLATLAPPATTALPVTPPMSTAPSLITPAPSSASMGSPGYVLFEPCISFY